MLRATIAAAIAASVKSGCVVVLLRDRERRAAVDHALHRRADRARVRDVVAEVRAVVDARRDEVEAVVEEAEERERDGVGGRAVDRPADRPVGERALAHAQRPHQRLRVADGTLVRVGRDDERVADRVERLLQREHAARLDAVVVRDQDPRPRRPLVERSRARRQRSRPIARRRARQRLAALQVEVAALDACPLAGAVGIRPGRRAACGRSESVALGTSGRAGDRRPPTAVRSDDGERSVDGRSAAAAHRGAARGRGRRRRCPSRRHLAAAAPSARRRAAVRATAGRAPPDPPARRGAGRRASRPPACRRPARSSGRRTR